MPKVTYLLVQEKKPRVYEILRPGISEDIPFTSKIQVLLDQVALANRDLVVPGPGQRIILEAWAACKFALSALSPAYNSTQLLKPVAHFHGRSMGDINKELNGGLNSEYLWRNETVNYLPSEPLVVLPGSLMVLILFKIVEKASTTELALQRYEPTRLKRCHTLIVPVEDDDRPTKKRATHPRDVTTEILERWLPDRVALPPINALSEFLDTPLRERAKIPLAQYRFDSLISNSLDVNRIGKRDLEEVFRVDDREHAEAIYRWLSSVLDDSPPYVESVHSYIPFWDSNIRKIIEALIPGGISIRDGCCHTSTASQKPSFGFLYQGVCVFRGEEKAPNDADDPKAELSSKMTWTYDPAPYVLGYYATGTVMTLVAICRPRHPQRSPAIIDLTKIDLRLKADRLKNLIRMINLCSLIVPITTTIGMRATADFH